LVWVPDEQQFQRGVDGATDVRDCKLISKPKAVRSSFDICVPKDQKVCEVIERAAAVHKALSLLDLKA
jgi:hypothetical protein